MGRVRSKKKTKEEKKKEEKKGHPAMIERKRGRIILALFFCTLLRPPQRVAVEELFSDVGK